MQLRQGTVKHMESFRVIGTAFFRFANDREGDNRLFIFVGKKEHSYDLIQVLEDKIAGRR